MSEESPPTYTTRIFNQANFGTTSGIDTAYLNAHYLRYPTAQTGTETIANLATTNDATINTISVGKGSTDTSTNVVLGYQSLTSIADNGGDPFNALQNIAIGFQSLPALTTGYKNIAIGGLSLNKLTVLFNNIAIGYAAGLNAVGGDNVAIGVGSLSGSAITTSNGNYNTAVGSGSLSTNTTGSNNTAIGYQAGQAGTANTTGTNNTYVGYQAQANANNYTKSTAIGSGATITASNQVVLGTTTETVRYNKLAPLYTSVPTYTSSEVGYIYSSDGTGSFTTGSVDFITVTNLALGVYIVKIDMTFSSPGSTTGSTFATLSIKKNSTIVSLATKGFAGLSTNAYVDAPVSLSAYLTSNGTDNIIVNRNLSTGMTGTWYFSYIRVA